MQLAVLSQSCERELGGIGAGVGADGCFQGQVALHDHRSFLPQR